MGDDSSYEEDFSGEITMFSTQDIELPKKETKKEESAFEILSIENIVQDVFEMVYKVQSFLALPSTTTARMLLTHYKWNFQQLIGEYYETDQDTFFQLAHVENPFNIPLNEGTDEAEGCKICYSEVTPEDLNGLSCGHKYCTSCWNSYLTVKIADEGLNESISCPEQSCSALVEDEHVMQWVEDHEVITKYHRSMSNGFVKNNQAMRWCPFPGCNYAAKKKHTANCPCVCKCGNEFCFDCCEYWHEPVTCTRLKQWKNSGDSETLQWIAENAKICPGCEGPIEKNGGCNHMTCRNCRHEFCWICMGEWRTHRACNRFDESKVIGHHGRELARFNHFKDRYVNQLESLRLEGINYRNLESKINDMKNDFSMTNNEVRFLRDAVKVLHVSRRTLCYTFVFAYFLKKNNHVEIFEDNQSDLETAVERLSGYLEQEMTEDNIVELKRQIQESYKYCEQRCTALMSHIREAEEKKLWQMS